jgi:uncharacterized protein (DUF58 family)
MRLPRSPLLDPVALARVKDLRLVARTLVDGSVAGLHRQPRAGTGVELEQFRSYQPGDDPRRIDWRAHARSDRLIVRESPVERDVTVRLIVDASASMGHGDGELSKLGYARMLGAALAFLALRQGDGVALDAVGAHGVDLPPLRRRRALERLLFALDGLEPGGTWPSWRELGPRLARPRRRELVVLISDLWDDDGAVSATLAGLRAMRHEVIVVHLLSRGELDFPWQGDAAFTDLESGAVVEGNGGELRPAYLRALAAWLAGWERRCAELAIAYLRVPLDEPLELVLRDVAARRRRAA